VTANGTAPSARWAAVAAAGAGALPERPASTSSRTRGAISWPNRWTSSAELTERMNVPKPCSSASSASRSASGPGSTFSSRRIAAGERPFLAAASSMRALISPIASMSR
jgi:hypothetical protein